MKYKVNIDWPEVCKCTYKIDTEIMSMLERFKNYRNGLVVIPVADLDNYINLIHLYTDKIRRSRTYEQKGT